MRLSCLLATKREPQSRGDDHHRDRGGNRQRWKEHPSPSQLRGNRELPRLVTQRAENFFEPLNLRIGFSRSVPQVVVVHKRSLMPSFSRKSFMPRCKLTLTDAAVRPVRKAISGPVIPSTSRNTSVSR